MHASPRPLVFLLCALVAGPAFAADKKKDKAEPLDAPPVLVSTKGGNAPKWKNVDELKQFALKGDPQACMELADRSLEGDGVPRDFKQAETLFARAAQNGNANGWFRLGKMSHDGVIGAPDYAKALEYFTTAARAGVAEAQHNIGAMLVSARGVRRDYIEGLAWLIVARQTGAPGEAEKQVRDRISRRPADITAAEMRAAEISLDLAHATPRTSATAAAVKPTALTKPETPTPTKAGLVAPKLDPVAPPKIEVPMDPVTTPKKP